MEHTTSLTRVCFCGSNRISGWNDHVRFSVLRWCWRISVWLVVCADDRRLHIFLRQRSCPHCPLRLYPYACQPDALPGCRSCSGDHLCGMCWRMLSGLLNWLHTLHRDLTKCWYIDWGRIVVLFRSGVFNWGGISVGGGHLASVGNLI